MSFETWVNYFENNSKKSITVWQKYLMLFYFHLWDCAINFTTVLLKSSLLIVNKFFVHNMSFQLIRPTPKFWELWQLSLF